MSKSSTSSKVTSSTPRAAWQQRLINDLLNHLLVAQRDSPGFPRRFDWSTFCESFRKRTATTFTDEQVKSKFQDLKKDFRTFEELKSVPGIGFDSTRFMLFCNDEKKWDEVLAERKDGKKFRTTAFPHYDLLTEIMGASNATGANAIASTQFVDNTSLDEEIASEEELSTGGPPGPSSSSSSSITIRTESATASEKALNNNVSPALSGLVSHPSSKTRKQTIASFITEKKISTDPPSNKRMRRGENDLRLVSALEKLAEQKDPKKEAMQIVDQEFPHLSDEDALELKLHLSDNNNAIVFLALTPSQRSLFVNNKLKK